MSQGMFFCNLLKQTVHSHFLCTYGIQKIDLEISGGTSMRDPTEQRRIEVWWEHWNRRSAAQQFATEEDRIRYEEFHQMYERYAKPFEQEYYGYYIAVGRNGEVVVGEQIGEVIRRANEQIGRGQNYLGRLGYRVTFE
jgi:hypothetical protein